MNKNIQPIEKKAKNDGSVLDVHSIFYTIQGEGPFCGSPAIFIRLAGCNLQCPGCDTDYTSKRNEIPIGNIIEAVLEFKQRVCTLAYSSNPIVVITGGEPFRQELEPLLKLLLDENLKVQIETNGTLAPPDLDWEHSTNLNKGLFIVCSPKTGKINQAILIAACALKYVATASDINPIDGLPNHALDHPAHPVVARPPKFWNRPIYLQPMDAQDIHVNQNNIDVVIESCMRFGYTLQLQIHKYINLK